MDLKILGQKIKEARKRANKTQEEVAFEIGTTKGVISNYETGKRDVSSKVLFKMAAFFNAEFNGDFIFKDKK